MPARIERPSAFDAELLRTRLELFQLRERLSHLLFLANDADEIVHRLLEFLVQRIGILAASRLERRKRAALGLNDRGWGDAGILGGQRSHVVGGRVAGSPTEYQQVGERVSAEPIRAVHSSSDLTGCEQARNPGCGL